VTREQLPQRAGSPGLNGGGTAAAVLGSPLKVHYTDYLGVQRDPWMWTNSWWVCSSTLLTISQRQVSKSVSKVQLTQDTLRRGPSAQKEMCK